MTINIRAMILIALEKQNLSLKLKELGNQVSRRASNWLLGAWALVEPSTCKQISQNKLLWTAHAHTGNGLIIILPFTKSGGQYTFGYMTKYHKLQKSKKNVFSPEANTNKLPKKEKNKKKMWR